MIGVWLKNAGSYDRNLGNNNWTVLAKISDGVDSVSEETNFFVRNFSDVVDPVVVIASPSDFAIVTAPTDLVATIFDDNILDWTVYLQKPDGSLQQEIGQGTTNVANAVVATIDPTLLKNGLYQVLIEARDTNGHYTTAGMTFTVEGQLKIGHFSVTFEELSINLAGIPLQVTRSYDSRERTESMDFGYGWSLDYQSVEVEESDVPGRGWSVYEQALGPITNVCVDLSYMKQVVVTLPGGSVEQFMPQFSPQCSAFTNGVGDLNFVAVDDTRSTLRQLDYSTVVVGNGELLDLNGALVDPTRYELTTEEGLVYIVTQGFGIEQVRDRNGNSLTYSDSAITHSTGVEVTFVRDEHERITSIIAPDGNVLSYDYDAQGDLRVVTDQLDFTTEHVYLAGHYLEDTIDARGITAVKNEYDAEGRLVAHIDANGNRIDMTHNIAGRQEVVTDRRGNAMIYAYDNRGNVVSETNALGHVVTRTYDSDDNMLSETDGEDNTTHWTYDARDNRLTEEDPLGHITHWTYNSRKQVLTEINTLGDVRTNTYDAAGNLVSIEDELGNITRYTYNSVGELTSTIDALNHTTTYDIDGNGRRSAMVDARGTRTTYTYDDMGRQVAMSTSRTSNSGELEVISTSNVYDAKGQLVETIDPAGNSSFVEYDAAGLEAARVDARGNRTEFAYDDLGRLVRTDYADNTSSSVEYDKEGNEVVRIDRLGLFTSSVFDAANQLIESVNSDLSSTRREYDAAGRPTADINTRGHRTEYTYDEAGRRVEVKNALNQVTQYVYDALDRNISITDALNQVTSYSYDAAGRLTQTMFDDGTTTADLYDALGRKAISTDEVGISTAYMYDESGNLLSVTDALGQVTSYSYDEQGNKRSQTDAEGRTTEWEYDVLGRNISRTLPLGQVESMTYDTTGNLASQTDFNNQTTSYTYNNINRNTQINHADGRVETRTYDSNGNVLSVDIDGAPTTYSYTDNRLTEVLYPAGNTISYAYDSESNRTDLNTDNQSVIYTFDALNRLSTVVQGGQTTSYSYNVVGNRASVSYPNGVAMHYSYDVRNRLTAVDHQEGAASIANYSYALADTSHRTQMTDHTGRVVDYSYDTLYRLVEEQVTDASNGDRTTRWTYDKVGNRLTQDVDGLITTYTYDANDRIQSEVGPDSISYTYDANGNTLDKTSLGNTLAYSYNSQNHVTGVDNGTDLIGFAYDHNGVRQSKTVNGVRTNFLVDTNRDYAQVLEEYDDSFNDFIAYVFGDDLISQDRNGTASFYQYDGLGSTRALTDSAGNLTDSYNYTAFGELENSVGSTENSYLYTGEQFDGDLGQYYLRARYYDQSVGRFTQMDTFQGFDNNAITLHKYLYGNDDPVNHTDPSGEVGLRHVVKTIAVRANLQLGITTKNLHQVRQASARLCKICGKLAKQANDAGQLLEKFSYSAVGKITSGTKFQAHHVFQDAALKAYVQTTYRKAFGLAIPLFGNTFGGGARKNTPHYFANQAQKGSRGKSPTHVAYKALVAAGCRKSDATEIVLMFETAYRVQGWL